MAEALLLVIAVRVFARDLAAGGRLLLGAGVRAGSAQLARAGRRSASSKA